MLGAERHPGPSLVIAHSPCIAHGYELVKSPLQRRKAAASGTWPLYRLDPRRVAAGTSPLPLDSGPPTIDVADDMAGEGRFRMVELRSPERYRELQDAARDAVRQRQALYEQLAHIRLTPEQHHG